MDFQQALTLHRGNRLDEAAAAYETLLAGADHRFEALYHFSLLRAQQGRLEDALDLARRAHATRSSDWFAQGHLGALLLANGRPEEALQWLRRALALNPGAPDLLNNCGAALRALGRMDEAYSCLARAVELAPDYVDARKNLAGVAIATERYGEAIIMLERLLASRPDSADLLRDLGRALWKAGRMDEAAARLREALRANPDFGLAWADLANLDVEVGRLEEAREHILRAIACDPREGAFYRHLLDIDPGALTADHAAMLESLSHEQLSPEQRVEVDFALARYAEARDEHERAFTHLLAANAGARARMSYDEAGTLHGFEAIAATFSSSFLASHRAGGDPSQLPVFIFGMPRSGTTLVEQLLASHPAVYGAGELYIFEEFANEAIASNAVISLEDMQSLNPSQLHGLGARYVAAMRELAGADAQRVTDKMPANFRYAGLISLALPNAKMIHLRRDPVETCLSCFRNTFVADNLAWSYDLAELGRYYRGYARLMEHWRAVLPPDAMLDVHYEALVEDFEAQARRIVAYVGLPWDDRVLAFHETRRPVRTASATQVRKPIYRSSLDSSKRYGEALKPLIEALSLASN